MKKELKTSGVKEEKQVREAINAIETEKYEPSIWLAYDISKVFGCTIEDVFLFDESPRKSRADCSRKEAKKWRQDTFGITMIPS